MKKKIQLPIHFFKWTLFVLLIFNQYYGHSQQPLKIGDKFPDIQLKNVLNYNAKELRLSQFKSKLIILDFWSTLCVSCIAAFPDIDSLQKKFAGKIQIVAVNQTDYDSTVRFFQKRKKIKLPGIPFITGDTLLHNYFSPTFVPWHIWLDSSLTVKYITYSKYANDKNIEAFIQNKPLNFYQLVDLSDKMKLSNGSALKYYSYIAPPVLGTIKNNYDYSDSSKVYFAQECTDVPDLVKWVLGKMNGTYYDFKFPLVIESKNESRLRNINNENPDVWASKNLFSYYLMLPIEEKRYLYQYIIQDIERYFKIKIGIKKRKLSCLVLVSKDGDEKLKTRGGASIDRLKINTIKFPVEDTQRFMQNMPFNQFYEKLKTWVEAEFKIPMKNETGIIGNIDIQLKATALDSWDLELWRKELAKYNLDIIKADRETDAIVIKDE